LIFSTAKFGTAFVGTPLLSLLDLVNHLSGAATIAPVTGGREAGQGGLFVPANFSQFEG
jgi:hypothetical protein